MLSCVQTSLSQFTTGAALIFVMNDGIRFQRWSTDEYFRTIIFPRPSNGRVGTGRRARNFPAVIVHDASERVTVVTGTVYYPKTRVWYEYCVVDKTYRARTIRTAANAMKTQLVLMMMLCQAAIAARENRALSRLVSKGEIYDSDMYPYVVRLYLSSVVRTFTCTGSLVSPLFVLTAAHCTDGSREFNIKVNRY